MINDFDRETWVSEDRIAVWICIALLSVLLVVTLLRHT